MPAAAIHSAAACSCRTTIPDRVGARVENSFVVTPDGGVELRDALGVR